MVKAFVASPPSAPTAGMPSRTRSTVAIFIAGVGIATVVGVVIDVLLMRWKARRQKRREARAETPGAAQPSHSAQPAYIADTPREPTPAAGAASVQEAGLAHGGDLVQGSEPVDGVDPAEAYSRNKHAAGDQVWTDTR
jgi:hypothetical protein